MSRVRTIARRLITLCCIALVLAAPAAAQDVPAQSDATRLPLLRRLPDPVPRSCPTTAMPAAPTATAADRQEAERLATEASNAAILGDLAAARDLLRRAAALDPSDPDIAFRHARALEELDEIEPAVGEYCRYLRLSPDAPDAAEVNATVRRIAPPVRPGVPDAAVTAFQEALAYADGGSLEAAVHAFTTVVSAAPDWPVGWHNRGVINAELRRREPARSDLVRFVELEPEGVASDAARGWISQLDATNTRYSPSTAFLAGLVPGAGHFYTGRTGMGALFLAGAGGAAAAGMLVQERHIECLGNPQGGVCPPDQVRNERVERPHMMIGIGVAAAATILGAIDAARGARQRNAEEPLVRFDTGPTSDGVGLLVPDVVPAPDRLDVALIRIRF